MPSRPGRGRAKRLFETIYLFTTFHAPRHGLMLPLLRIPLATLATLMFLAPTARAQAEALPLASTATATVFEGSDSVAPPPPSVHQKTWVRWAAPAGEAVGVNLLFAGYNLWITDAEWARVGWGSIRNNFTSPWEWDYDRFSINQIGHPYQGGLYYSAARSFGHGFWKSTAYTAAGSLQWEYFMEREAPSYNDFVTTTMGGAMLGEISFRLAQSLLDESATGFERAARELGATAVSPVYGLNRLLNGRPFVVRRADQKRKPTPLDPAKGDGDGYFRLSTGADLPFFSSAQGDDPDVHRQSVPKPNTEFLAVYGDEFTATKPYDYFIVNAGVSIIQNPVLAVTGRAQLFKHDLFETRRGEGLFMLGQNFDYLNNGLYKLGTSGLGSGYSHRFRWGKGWSHLLHAQVGVILVGGVSTEFFREHERDYNLGPGLYSNTRLVLVKQGFGHVALLGDRYWVHTRSGAQGDELIGFGQLEVSKTLSGNVSLLVNSCVYDRSARYSEFGARSEVTQDVKLKLSYLFD